MALPTVSFNSSSGSDTQASGAGPATALFGSNAVTVTTTNTVSLSTDSPDLSGVATDGSAVLWVASSSGRRWSKITAINNSTKVVTCQDNFANSETKSWAIGGKRATLASSTQFGSDVYEGWTVNFENDGSLAISAAFTWATNASASDGKLIIQSNNTTIRTCVQSSNAACFIFSAAASVTLNYLKFTCSNGTRTSANGLSFSAATQLNAYNCIFGDSTNKLNSAHTRTAGNPNLTFVNCTFTTLITGTCATGTGTTVKYLFCFVNNGASHGITLSVSSMLVKGCLIVGNGGSGVNLTAVTSLITFEGNTIHGNTSDGLTTTSASINLGIVYNNNFTGNGGFGWNAMASADNNVFWHGFNNYGTGLLANTSGARNNISAGVNDLAVDPGYTSTGTNDYSVGTSVKALGSPDSTLNIGANQSATKSFVDVGCSQRQESSSVASGFITNLGVFRGFLTVE